jgi:hypothetical protein
MMILKTALQYCRLWKCEFLLFLSDPNFSEEDYFILGYDAVWAGRKIPSILRSLYLYNHDEEGGIIFFRNVDNVVPDYIAS